jgi:hypothetical protein
MATTSSAEEPFLLTIRFTTSTADLELDIEHPSSTTVIHLKSRIREHLPPSDAKSRLRLIYAGRLLTDNQILSSVLKPPPPPPPHADAKGKAPELPPPRIYINCSIGDVLSLSELDAERASARASTPVPPASQTRHAQQSTTTPAPRGFDRLLQSGFSATEVAALRSQFLAIQASAHTADSMPSPAALRQLEDAWLDDGGALGGGGNEATVDANSSELDDMVWGMVMGFFWPLGLLTWGRTLDGVWSARKWDAIVPGIGLAIGFGLMRILSDNAPGE